MRFACLVYFDPHTAFDNSSAANAVLGEAEANRRQMLAAGAIAEALVLPADAVTARVRDGRISTTDGPFAETKEVLGGLVLIEAADMAAAIAVAATNPMARLGSVEVPPMVDFSQPRPVL